ncbi:MAG: NFACT RNA binding domain-containing protein [Bacteroidota bacterium]|nr:NFACT RNA binding domain-containing protein [Bacteroidota bacterium]
MLNHFTTLQNLAEEFSKEFKSGTILEIFSQQKNELIISVSTHGTIKALVVSINPQMNFVFLREQIARAKRNSVLLFKEVTSAHIQRCTGHIYERTIKISLSDGWSLYLNLYGTASSNIFLTDENDIIINSFKNSKDFAGKKYNEITTNLDEDIMNLIPDFKSFEKQILSDENKTTFKSLKSVYPFLGSTLTREALHRSKVEDKVHVSELTTEDYKHIFQKLKEIFIELSKPEPTIYYTGDVPRVLSMIQLQHLSGATAESYKSVNEAVKNFVIKSFKAHNIDSDKKDLLLKIRNELDKARRTEKALQYEVLESDRAKNYEHVAKVILANLQHLTKGTKEIDIEDVFNNNKLMSITLDPKLNPAQNAEKYFDKARKAKIAHVESIKRLAGVKKQTALLEKLLLHLDNCHTKEQVNEFKEEYETDLKAMHLITSKEKADLPPFRIFKVIGGFEVWVGKSSANNELLTMKYAKPNDLWFHARGSSGSHTVLRVGNSKTQPGKEAVRQAASIAAYYSKMRNASNVPVGYCEKKYVRKPRNAPAGTVTMEREKVIFVEPGLPDEN